MPGSGKPERSAFGLVITILTLIVVFAFSFLAKFIGSAIGRELGSEVGTLASIGIRWLNPFRIFSKLCVVAGFIAFFARKRWVYLVGAGLMVIDLLWYMINPVYDVVKGILAGLMVLAFVIDWYRNRGTQIRRSQAG